MPILAKKQLQNIINEKIVKVYKQNGALGIILFGSVARGGYDEFSDLDIYVLFKSNQRYSRENFLIGELRVDIIIDDLKKANDFLKKERYSVNRAFSHMLSSGKILYAKNGKIKKLQREAKKNLRLKTRVSRDELLMHLYSIDDFYGEVSRYVKNDPVAFEQNATLLLNNIIECFLKINGEYFRRSNEMMAVINNHDKNFGGLLRRYYIAANRKSKLHALTTLVRYMYRLTDGPLPERWKVR